MEFDVKVVLDSIAPNGARLTTLEVTMPRFLLAQWNTHRQFCLDGDTELYFDLPGGRGKPGRRLYKLTIRQLHDKWHLGIQRPVWRRYEYDSSKVDPMRIYRTGELAELLGVDREAITRLCRIEGLPHSATGTGKGATFYIKGSDFVSWLSRRPVAAYDAKRRLQRMALRCCDEATSEISYTKVNDVFFSGVKPVFRVTFEDGKFLVCSKDHQCLTDSGWKTLEEAVGLSWSVGGLLHWNEDGPRFAVNGIPAYTDSDWLLQKRREGLSAKEIADLAGVSPHRVKYQFRKHRIGVQDLGLVLRRPRRAPWNKGKTYSNPKLKGRPGKPQPRGPESRLWKGGITPERVLIGQWTQQVAPDIHQTNGFRCVICASDRDLRAHHVDPVYRSPERARDITNLTTLCQRCHIQIHARYLEEVFFEEYHQGSLSGFWERHRDTRRSRPAETRPPGHVTVIRKWVRVKSIEYVGERETYDLAVEGPWHNFVANGVIVHNSRNAASSRAIPVAKMLERIREHPFVPEEWGTNQKGMQAGPTLSGETAEEAREAWLACRDDVIRWVERLHELGVHKQLANRLLEPFMWVTVIVSSTEWANFLNLRCHEDAQPQFQRVARMVADALAGSTPHLVAIGEWHLPYIQADERAELPLEVQQQCSVARCARVSYLTHDGKRDIEKDQQLYERLLGGSGFGHWSPFEHVATPRPTAAPDPREGNFKGWLQYRKMFANECQTRWPNQGEAAVAAGTPSD